MIKDAIANSLRHHQGLKMAKDTTVNKNVWSKQKMNCAQIRAEPPSFLDEFEQGDQMQVPRWYNQPWVDLTFIVLMIPNNLAPTHPQLVSTRSKSYICKFSQKVKNKRKKVWMRSVGECFPCFWWESPVNWVSHNISPAPLTPLIFVCLQTVKKFHICL